MSLSSSSSSTSTDTVGSQGGEGSLPVSINLESYKSNGTAVNLNFTDGGAFDLVGNVVSALGESVRQIVMGATGSNEEVLKVAVGSNERVAADANRRVVDVVNSAGTALVTVVDDAFAFGRRTLESLDDAVDAARSATSEALYQSQSVVALTERLNDQNTFFLTDVNKKNAELTSEVIRNSELLTGEVIRTVEDLEQMRLVESGKVIGTIKELAETVQTGGESIQQNVNKLVVYAALAMAGLIAWRALA